MLLDVHGTLGIDIGVQNLECASKLSWLTALPQEILEQGQAIVLLLVYPHLGLLRLLNESYGRLRQPEKPNRSCEIRLRARRAAGHLRELQ
jgi:hypothetical protein